MLLRACNQLLVCRSPRGDSQGEQAVFEHRHHGSGAELSLLGQHSFQAKAGRHRSSVLQILHFDREFSERDFDFGGWFWFWHGVLSVRVIRGS